MRSALAVLAISIAMIGCAPNTSYRKTVTVRKDAQGKVIDVLVVEELEQPSRSEVWWPFKYLEE